MLGIANPGSMYQQASQHCWETSVVIHGLNRNQFDLPQELTLRTACHLKQIAAARGSLAPLPFEHLLDKPLRQPTIHSDISKEWSQAFCISCGA